MTKVKILRWALIGFLFTITLVAWLEVWRRSPGSELSISFLDVGQGDAILIEAPNGNQVLIDGGSGQQVLRALGEVMPFYDRSLDLVVATHSDTDHVGGLSFVFERLAVASLMTNGEAGDNSASALLETRFKEEKVPLLLARAGVVVQLDEEVTLEILYPDRALPASNPNDASVVALLRYGQTEFVLTGDAPAQVENILAARLNSNLEIEVLKLGHHGSETSSSEYFLAALRPEYAVISAGEDNRYGHPHEEVLARLRRLNIPYFNTADLGTITFRSNGLKVTCSKCQP